MDILLYFLLFLCGLCGWWLNSSITSIDIKPHFRYFMVMIQLYFLSILCNGLCGYILFTGKENNGEKTLQLSFNNPTFHLVLGILSAVIGLLKLLSPFEGIAILGDLIPAGAGIISGLLLVFGIYRQDIDIDSPGTISRFAITLLSFKKTVGLILIVIAVVHFLFPKALFL